MDQLTPNSVIKSVRSFRRDGGIALVECDTLDGEKVTLRFDIRYLWSVAADMRTASIDLIAPVPEALRAALGSEADEEEEEASTKKSTSASEGAEEPRSGFAGLEQAWTLCDSLNDAQLSSPKEAPEAVFSRIASGHFLLDADAGLTALDSGYEVPLKNEFKLVYRTQTKDWIPDRRDKAPEPGAEVS
ncbi:hypothetical protein T8K17_08535 [Thalassobaculum sp. OXR-137]|uniref:hypothetical protein n=1 Tax=Thalassobaculum sp. OXR-137 TaxID=3100173 RepID=UPI002AC9A88E|nr:hypothetical protein [Thalassobaculum sp. OXR-137]WPZ36181.1 hypothetical protein T8K17_08535 [Thalassobaculum sp. OXR-137]